MKQVFFILLLTANLFLSDMIQAQNFSDLDKSPIDITYFRPERGSTPIIKVVYGRPQLKGRKVGVDLATYGNVWRTGANEATEIKFYKDITMGDQVIKAGTYSLFTIPDKGEWTIIINSELDTWGAYSYDESKDIARIKVRETNGEGSVEAFCIAFKSVNKNLTQMVLAWDTTRVIVPFKY